MGIDDGTQFGRDLAASAKRDLQIAATSLAGTDPSTRHIGDRARRAINAKAAGLMASGMTQADADAWANAAVEGFRSTMADRDRVH